MYCPTLFSQKDRVILEQLIRNNSFATLISQDKGVPIANHFPMLYQANQGEWGTLQGHMARANPQWKSFSSQKEILAIFHGPHCYISPLWYRSPNHVPTWNYLVVHVYGTIKTIEDHTALHTQLEKLIAQYESEKESPFHLLLPEKKLEAMLQAIVGFEILITRIEGKSKLNQNRTPKERENVIKTLLESEDPQAKDIANWMISLKNTYGDF